MKRWGRLILVLIAYGFALLHTAVPHHHATSRNGETTISHSGCSSQGAGGLLGWALSTDLGYGHLENFKKSADTEVIFSTEAAPFADLAARVVISPASCDPVFDGYIAKLKGRLLLFASTQFRAPPAFS